MAQVEGKFTLKGDGSHALGAIKSVQRATGDLSRNLNTSLKDNLAEAFSVGVILEATTKLVEFADNTIKAADNLDVTTDSFQALRVAAREAGKDMSLFEKSFVNIEKAASDALGGDSKAHSIFKALGISDEDLHNLDKVSLLQKIAQGTQGVSRNQAVGDLEGLGIRGQNANALVAIKDTLANFGDFKKGLQANGQIASNKDLNNVAALKDEWDDFTDEVKTDVLPALSIVIDALTKFGRGLVQLAELAGTAIGAILGNVNSLTVRGTLKGLANGANQSEVSAAESVAGVLSGQKGIGEAISDWFGGQLEASKEVVNGAFGKEGSDNINKQISDKLLEFNKDDQDFEARSAARRKAREDAEKAKEGLAGRTATPRKLESALSDTIKGGDSSLVKIGALGGIDTAYRLARLSQEANNYLKTIAANTDPKNNSNDGNNGITMDSQFEP